MLTTSASKFCVEPRSPIPDISHHDPQTMEKPSNIVSWPECRPEFPDDADGNAEIAVSLANPISQRAQGQNISRKGNPSLR